MDFWDIVMAAATQGGGGLPPEPGNELWVQPAFDAATGITLNGWAIAAGQADNQGELNAMSATALETLEAGTYRIEVNIVAIDDGCRIRVGGAGNIQSFNDVGSHTADLVVGSISNQLITVSNNQQDPGLSLILTSLSVKKLG